jgi:hypothetical protein
VSAICCQKELAVEAEDAEVVLGPYPMTPASGCDVVGFTSFAFMQNMAHCHSVLQSHSLPSKGRAHPRSDVEKNCCAARKSTCLARFLLTLPEELRPHCRCRAEAMLPLLSRGPTTATDLSPIADAKRPPQPLPPPSMPSVHRRPCQAEVSPLPPPLSASRRLTVLAELPPSYTQSSKFFNLQLSDCAMCPDP